MGTRANHPGMVRAGSMVMTRRCCSWTEGDIPEGARGFIRAEMNGFGRSAYRIDFAEYRGGTYWIGSVETRVGCMPCPDYLIVLEY